MNEMTREPGALPRADVSQAFGLKASVAAPRKWREMWVMRRVGSLRYEQPEWG